MKNKIKFLPHICEYRDQEDLWWYDIQGEVGNPTPYKNMKDGQYRIRGDKRGCYIDYVVINTKWYLICEYFYVKNVKFKTMVDYELFPNLPEREYDLMNKVYSKLSQEWKDYCYAKDLWWKGREYVKVFKKTLNEK